MPEPRFLTICLNPVLQKTLGLDRLVPGAVNRLAAHRLDASGKGINVTRVLDQLGESVVHLTQLGGRFREQFLSLVADDALDVCWRDSGSEIRFCYTLLEARGAVTTEIVEEAEPVGSGTEEKLALAFAELLGAASWVTFSGTRAAGFGGALYPRWVAAAKAARKGVVLDVKGGDLQGSLAAAPDVIKPNYDEFAATFLPERGSHSVSEVREVMTGIARRYHTAVVVTRGSDETLVATATEAWTQQVEPVDPVNTTGSGDACTAGIVAVLARGGTLREAVAEGHRCGALNAQRVRPGTIR
jgi:1-phosphofructokinase/tagatose 6-phosphate kinase